MTQAKKILLIVGTSLLVLLTLSNSFLIYLLITTYQTDSSSPNPFYEWNERKQLLLRYDSKSPIDPAQSKRLISQTLKDHPSILCDEPVILIANPDLKPLVAEILEEDTTILESYPITLHKYPELMEMNPNLEPILDGILERTDNPYITSLFL